MRILAIYRHYWPDTTPYARLLRSILEHRVAEGSSCAVYTGQPSYNDTRSKRQPSREVLGGVEVVRGWTPPERKRLMPLRLFASLWFLTASIIFAWRRRRDFDVVLANVHPPILMGWTLRIIRRLTGLPYILHMQDIHPEALIALGSMRRSRFSGLLRRIDAASCRKAWRVVTLSQDMASTLSQRPGCASLASMRVINNFPLESFDGASRAHGMVPQGAASDSEFVVLFAGNLGRFQALPRLVDAAALLDDLPIQFVFMGTGAVEQQLKDKVAELRLENVTFAGHQSVETAVAAMSVADLGVVSLAEGVCRVAYPSKSMTYLSAGLPLFALVEDDSDLAKEVAQHGFGYAPGQVEGEELAAAIRAAYADRRRWTAENRAKLAVSAEKVFGKDRALRSWDEIAVEWGSEPKEDWAAESRAKAA